MKILDEKGKLFGKINLVDLVVIVVILAVVAGVGWKLVGSRVSNAVAANNAVTIRYEIICPEIDDQTAAYCVENYDGQLMSNGEMIDGRIVGCTSERQMQTLLDSAGNAVAVPMDGQNVLHFTIECKAPWKQNAYAVGTQEVRVGKSHIVKSTTIEVLGTISSLEVVTDAAEDENA